MIKAQPCRNPLFVRRLKRKYPDCVVKRMPFGYRIERSGYGVCEISGLRLRFSAPSEEVEMLMELVEKIFARMRKTTMKILDDLAQFHPHASKMQPEQAAAQYPALWQQLERSHTWLERGMR